MLADVYTRTSLGLVAHISWTGPLFPENKAAWPAPSLDTALAACELYSTSLVNPLLIQGENEAEIPVFSENGQFSDILTSPAAAQLWYIRSSFSR